MKKNDILKLKIIGMTHDGSGVGRNDGMAVFVNNTAIGDEIEALVLKVKKTYAVAKLQEIIKPASVRTDYDCDVFLKCGGCKYQHIKYETELEIKEQKVIDAVKRVGRSDASIRKIVSSENVYRYRNKGQYPATTSKDGKVTFGFFAPHSHRVIECNDCLLSPIEFRDIISTVKNLINKFNISAYNEETGTGVLRHLCLRRLETSGEICVVFVVNADFLPFEDEIIKSLCENKDIKSIVINVNKEKTNVILGRKDRVVYGDGYITDILCGKKFKISAKSFYQVNSRQTEKLYSKAAEYAKLTKNDVLLDLYCGVGTIGITMADKCKKLYGVEIVKDAVINAKENAKLNNLENTEFFDGDASRLVVTLKERGIKPDVVILDPPRKGCTKDLIKTVTDDFKPKRVVYVSCDPATLARDIEIFERSGYKAIEITPFDMFPKTVHVESVCLIERKE